MEPIYVYRYIADKSIVKIHVYEADFSDSLIITICHLIIHKSNLISKADSMIYQTINCERCCGAFIKPPGYISIGL